MNNNLRRILTNVISITALTLVGYGQQVPSEGKTVLPSPGTSEEVVTLPAFNVTSTAANKYQAAEAMSASRTAGKIIDTPTTVNVVTPALLDQIGPATISRVTQYFAGVSPGRGTGTSGINDRLTLRGFESFSRTIDNFSGFLFPQGTASALNFDPVFVDHIELVMGPNAVLAPTGSPGGSVNLITKSPLFTQGTDISAQVGNYDSNKFMVDSTGPIGKSKRMAYRVIAGYTDAQTYAPGSSRTFAGSAQFAYKFSDSTNFTIKYFRQETSFRGTAALSNINGQQAFTSDTVGGVTLPDKTQPGFRHKGANGTAKWSQRTIHDNNLQAELISAFGERVTMRLAAQYSTDRMKALLGFPSNVITSTFDQATGQVISVTPVDTTALPVVGSLQRSESDQYQIQNDYAGNFKISGISIQPVVGWTYQYGSTPQLWDLRNRNLPPADLSADRGRYNPPKPAITEFPSVSRIQTQKGNLYQGYANLRVGILNERVFFTAGISRSTATNVRFTDFSSFDTVTPGGLVGVGPATRIRTLQNTGNALLPRQSKSKWSETAGVVAKVLPNLSLYYNFSQNSSIGDQPLWQIGEQDEIGIKSEWFKKRLTVNAAYFDITQSNVSASNPLFNTGQSTVPFLFSNLTSDGYEVNVTGGITSDLSVIASFTTQELRDNVGRRRRNIPDNMASLLLNYQVPEGALKNVAFSFGAIHRGKVPGENQTGFTTLGVAQQPGFFIANYTVYNLGASYKTDRYTIHLNVDNVFDDRFWAQASSRTSVAPYPGITFRLSVARHF